MLRKKQLQRKGGNRQKYVFLYFFPERHGFGLQCGTLPWKVRTFRICWLLSSCCNLRGGDDRSGIERKSSFWPPEKDPLRLFFSNSLFLLLSKAIFLTFSLFRWRNPPPLPDRSKKKRDTYPPQPPFPSQGAPVPEEQDPPKSLHLLLDHRPLLDHRAGATGKKKGKEIRSLPEISVSLFSFVSLLFPSFPPVCALSSPPR